MSKYASDFLLLNIQNYPPPSSGYYADTEARCQAYHVCADAGRSGQIKYTFLCPNGESEKPESRDLSLVQINQDTVLSLVEPYYNLTKVHAIKQKAPSRGHLIFHVRVFLGLHLIYLGKSLH